jgi:hypothetical protein
VGGNINNLILRCPESAGSRCHSWSGKLFNLIKIKKGCPRSHCNSARFHDPSGYNICELWGKIFILIKVIVV